MSKLRLNFYGFQYGYNNITILTSKSQIHHTPPFNIKNNERNHTTKLPESHFKITFTNKFNLTIIPDKLQSTRYSLTKRYSY